MALTVLTWNLFHGRAVPAAGRSLRDEFAAALAGWAWDVALLQEVPPWWPPALAAAAGADQRTAPTSRNALAPVRRAIAERAPDLARASGGGANTILVRGPAILEHRRRRVRLWPERRVVHGVRLHSGLWAVNLHASVPGTGHAAADGERARAAALEWAADAPLVLGGDFNVVEPELAGFARAAVNRIDAIFARGLEPAAGGDRLARGALSDHAPLRATLRRGS